MAQGNSRLVLLGPQRFRPTLRPAMDSLGLGGPVAVITAGWQERETEDRELEEHLACEVVDLRLYHRADEVRQADPPLAAARPGDAPRARHPSRVNPHPFT